MYFCYWYYILTLAGYFFFVFSLTASVCRRITCFRNWYCILTSAVYFVFCIYYSLCVDKLRTLVIDIVFLRRLCISVFSLTTSVCRRITCFRNWYCILTSAVYFVFCNYYSLCVYKLCTLVIGIVFLRRLRILFIVCRLVINSSVHFN
jgi:hypothetical protein